MCSIWPKIYGTIVLVTCPWCPVHHHWRDLHWNVKVFTHSWHRGTERICCGAGGCYSCCADSALNTTMAVDDFISVKVFLLLSAPHFLIFSCTSMLYFSSLDALECCEIEKADSFDLSLLLLCNRKCECALTGHRVGFVHCFVFWVFFKCLEPPWDVNSAHSK